MIIILLSNLSAQTQDLLTTLNQNYTDTIFTTIATFKSTRLGLMHTTETRKKGALQLSIYQRYWDTPAATSQSFLADKLNNRFGLDYAFTDNFTFGFGYSDFDNVYDAYLKLNIKKQKEKGFNISILQTFSMQDLVNNTLYANSNSNRFGFTTQAIFSKKINRFLSLQDCTYFSFQKFSSK
ncbi:MAG: hypothetical protein HC798_04865 [Polaribacter sp.]|nr:hypothetical protein [Polaribacter sp.]